MALNHVKLCLKWEGKKKVVFQNLLSVIKRSEAGTACLRGGSSERRDEDCFFLVPFPASFPVTSLCLECWWEMLVCFCLQQVCCFDFVWVVWKTVRHLEWVFCVPAIWPLHIYFSCLLHDDKGTKETQVSSWIFFFLSSLIIVRKEEKERKNKVNRFSSSMVRCCSRLGFP